MKVEDTSKRDHKPEVNADALMGGCAQLFESSNHKPSLRGTEKIVPKLKVCELKLHSRDFLNYTALIPRI